MTWGELFEILGEVIEELRQVTNTDINYIEISVETQ